MSHDSSAMRLAGFLVISLVGYWAFIEVENYDPNAEPSRIGPGAQVETCGTWGALLNLCHKRARHVRADAVQTIANGYRVE